MATQLLTPRSNEQRSPKAPYVEVHVKPAGHCKASATSRWRTNVNKAVLVRWGWGVGMGVVVTPSALYTNIQADGFAQLASKSMTGSGAFWKQGRCHLFQHCVFTVFWLIGVIMKITFSSSLPTTQNLTRRAFNVPFKIQIFVCITLSARLWTSVIFEWPAPLWLRDFPGFAN